MISREEESIAKETSVVEICSLCSKSIEVKDDEWTMLPFGKVHNKCFESVIGQISTDLSNLSSGLQDLWKVIMEATESCADILYSITGDLGEVIKNYEDEKAARREAKIVRRKERHYRMTHGKHGLKRPK